MPLSHGCNHVTIITQDLDRFIAFYQRNFDVRVQADLSEKGLRHALLDLGAGFCLHPFELDPIPSDAAGSPTMFTRGHIDHFAINFAHEAEFEEARRRLVNDGASAGRVRDFGMVQVMAFEDPDGMECELALWKDSEPLSMTQSRIENYVPA